MLSVCDETDNITSAFINVYDNNSESDSKKYRKSQINYMPLQNEAAIDICKQSVTLSYKRWSWGG